jgi:hypothetical protein
MNRREFVAAVAAGAAAVQLGCRNKPEQPAATTQQPADTPAAAAGAQVTEAIDVSFHGMCVVAMQPMEKNTLDIAFPNMRLIPDLPVMPHIPTLVVAKEDLTMTSDRVPSASTEENAYFLLAGEVRIIPRDSDDPKQWGAPPADSLVWKDSEVKQPEAPQCVPVANWNDLGWVLEFAELHPGAELPADWRKQGKMVGWVRLGAGSLETDDVKPDPSRQHRYKVPSTASTTRVLKETLRYRLKSKFAQFLFDDGTSAIVPGGTEVQVFHVPTPGMDVGTELLVDYRAVYPVVLDGEGLRALGSREHWPTLSDRTACTPTQGTPRSGGCGALKMKVKA